MQPVLADFLTPFVGDMRGVIRHKPSMLGTREILVRVRPLATNAELSRVLKLPDSRIAELYSGKRKLQLEEAKKLVDEYELEDGSVTPLSIPVAKLMVMHVALGLGTQSPEDAKVQELAKDLAAFSMCAGDPQLKDQVDALAQILRGIDARRRADG